MEAEEMRKRLAGMGIAPAEARFYAGSAETFAPDLREAFENYLRTGEPCEYSHNGWTLAAVMAHTHSKPPYSYLYFDKMMKNAKYAEYFAEMDFGEE